MLLIRHFSKSLNWIPHITSGIFLMQNQCEDFFSKAIHFNDINHIYETIYERQFYWYISRYLTVQEMIKVPCSISTCHAPILLESHVILSQNVSPLPLRKTKSSLLHEPCDKPTLLHSQPVPKSYQKSKNC